jgi:cytochrome oxidase Cu insertion factor (SCO1/SenC/PrrC family)
VLAAATLAVSNRGLAHEEAASAPVRPPDRLFEPPPPGSYELPPIQRVREHHLLDSSGEQAPVLGLESNQVAVVSFVYRSCSDASGCPLALSVLRRLDRDLHRTQALRKRVRLVTVSFDPARDTPERMRELRRHLAPRCDWRFLTAGDEAEIAPVLADYGQDVVRFPRVDDESPDVAGHVLRVFLVDASGAVRNEYSADFLDAEILRNDAATVLGVPAGALRVPEAP